MDGVLNVKRLRLRRAGNRYFVDATVSVPRTASLEQVHAWSDAIEQRVGEIVPSDVVVHAEPRAPKGEPFFDSIRAVAQRRGLAIHDLSAQQNDGRLFVELHLEIDPHLSLKEAHAQATELEEEIRGLRQEPTEVNIHIEPLGTAISSPDAGAENLRVLARAIESFLNQLPAEYHELLSSHNVVVRQVEHHILASCHCVIRSELPVMEVHDVTAALEDRVKEKFPQIYRVTIHPEPEDA
jgi:divalent metal cation (Fe/Co/Zn/Cd) transporter